MRLHGRRHITPAWLAALHGLPVVCAWRLSQAPSKPTSNRGRVLAGLPLLHLPAWPLGWPVPPPELLSSPVLPSRQQSMPGAADNVSPLESTPEGGHVELQGRVGSAGVGMLQPI